MATYTIQLSNQPFRNSKEYALMLRITCVLTTDLNATTKQNILIPPFWVVDLMRDTEGGFLLYSGANSHVRFSS